MNGSRLARGRMGRLALLACVTVAIVIVMFAYRTTSSEMARLRDLHVKCAQQQEALAAQLQVIYEYKVQLEKTLLNEKSANAAAKEELQQKATRERTLRDKDSLEATQRFNALQQNYKLLQHEQDDLREECKKKEAEALEKSKKQEAELNELRKNRDNAYDEKEHAVESLKNKYLEVTQEKERLEEKLVEMSKQAVEDSSNLENLRKQVAQLQRELEDAKKAAHFSVGGVKTENSILQRPGNDAALNNNIEYINNKDNQINNEDDKQAAIDNNPMQVIKPSSSQQQASVSTSNSAKFAAAAPLPVSQSLPDGASKSTPERSVIAAAVNVALGANAKLAPKVKLPLGVPPIPQLYESARKEDALPAADVKRQPIAPDQPELFEHHKQVPQIPGRRHDEANGRHIGAEQDLNRHESDGWPKMKAGLQEVGDPHHVEKNGFKNGGGNEDVEQYEDYNYKEPQNKNGDLHLEEEEGEREDEDDYMHNNANIVMHE